MQGKNFYRAGPNWTLHLTKNYGVNIANNHSAGICPNYGAKECKSKIESKSNVCGQEIPGGATHMT